MNEEPRTPEPGTPEPRTPEPLAAGEEMAAFKKVLNATLTERPAAEDVQELKRWLTERPSYGAWRAIWPIWRRRT